MTIRRVCALLVVLLTFGLMSAALSAADQCAPPGEQAASALPTNLAAAATGPGEDRYTTASTEPLGSADLNTLR